MWQQTLWTLLDDPSSSPLAKCISTFAMAVIALSVLSFTFESIPDPTTCKVFDTWDTFTLDDGNTVQVRSDSATRLCLEPETPRTPFAEIETFCIMVFSVEVLLRLISCPANGGWRIGIAHYFVTPMNWIDVVAILPWYIDKALPGGSDQIQGLAVLRVLRLTRVVRVFKMSRNFRGLIILYKTMEKSMSALGMLVFFVILALILFSTLMFEAEKGPWDPDRQQWVRWDGTPNPFESIVTTMWWCIITMCTVGYGDVWPITGPGLVVAMVTMFAGVLIISLPISIVGGNFDEVYKKQLQEEADEKARRKHEAKLALHRLQESGAVISASPLERRWLTMKGDPYAQVLKLAENDLSSHPLRLVHKAIQRSNARVTAQVEALMQEQAKKLSAEIHQAVLGHIRKPKLPTHAEEEHHSHPAVAHAHTHHTGVVVGFPRLAPIVHSPFKKSAHSAGSTSVDAHQRNQAESSSKERSDAQLASRPTDVTSGNAYAASIIQRKLRALSASRQKPIIAE